MLTSHRNDEREDMSDSFDLTGNVALITGATKGIGRGIVQRFLESGASVAFSSRTASDCGALEADLNAAFPNRAAGFASDLEVVSSLQALAADTIARFGRIDTLVCNAAALGGHGKSMELDVTAFERSLRVNVVHNFELIRAVLPQMVARGSGNIILITSISAYSAMPQVMAYGAAKAALANLGKNLAAEYASKGIRVNTVSPGTIRSASFQAAYSDPAKLAAYTAANVPMDRAGENEDVGNACVYLASAASAYTTGATIPVDGGRLGISAPTGR